MCFVSDTLVCFQQLLSAAHCSSHVAQCNGFVGCLNEKWLLYIFIIPLDIWQFSTFFLSLFILCHSVWQFLIVTRWALVGLQLLFQIFVFCPYKFTFKDDRTTYQMLFFSLVYNSHWNSDLSLTVHWEPIAYSEFQFSLRMFRQKIAMHSRYIYTGSYCCLNCSKKMYSPEIET